MSTHGVCHYCNTPITTGYGLSNWNAREHAANASTKPAPVATSCPGCAESPKPVAPRSTSRAVSDKISLTFAGERFGLADNIRATVPATCGAAADVPEKIPHPRLLDMLGIFSEASSLSGGTGSMIWPGIGPGFLYSPTMPHTSGTARPGERLLIKELA